MTIYDVPVADTEFFPVSGDMMRQMKADEERRDRIIRERLAKHRAEHLIGILRNENGTGDPAKNLPDAADPDHLMEEQTMQDDTSTISEAPDVNRHPLWCDETKCVLPIREGDITLHTQNIGSVKFKYADDAIVDMTQADDDAPRAYVTTSGEMDLSLPELERFILVLMQARRALAQTGEA